MSKDMMIYFDDGREPMTYDDTYDILIHCDSEEARQKTIERITFMQWIPCSESLPEDEQPILFSTTTGRVHQGRFHRDNSVNRWYSSLDKMRAYNNVVNAWMPLPEPYKEDDHD